jgi:DNA-binding response OmpR family regulator
MSRILIIEDEEAIAELEKDYLELSNFEVDIEGDGEKGLQKALAGNYDMFILDLMLPGIDGFELCKRIREVKDVPILMVTAKKEEIDKIRGLGLGADDYITKPFSVRELMARIKANLRKTEVKEEVKEVKPQETEGKKVVVGPLELDLDKFEAKVDGKTIDLTIREFEVLKFLACQAGQIITREVLLEKVWGYEYYGDIRTVDVTVRRIRGKIEKDSTTPKILVTKRGVGYYIKAN